ncbi:MAG: phytoene/squalene synthase family protein [Pseudomonadota bacterium]
MPSRDLDRAEAAALRDIIRVGSRSFHAAGRLLPRRVREAAFALYAFCRDCDDLIDEHGADGASKRINDLHRRLDEAYRGAPRDTVVDRAFAQTVNAYDIPRSLPEALIEGLSWDVDGRRYATLDDLHDYAARVAGTVGAMMTVVMGVRSPQALSRATDLGAAMQLTNIARDVGDDARNGRIYLPLDWLEDAGVAPNAFLANPQPTYEIRSIVARLLDEADRLYDRGLAGVFVLPAMCRPAITSAALVYADIGRKIRARGCDSVTSRAIVSKSRKLALLTQAAATLHIQLERLDAPPLSANRFLVKAVSGVSAPSPTLTPIKAGFLDAAPRGRRAAPG